MTVYRKIGIGIIVLGVMMFLVGASLFTYQGDKPNHIISNIGMFSFMLWLPTLILGIILVSRNKKEKKKLH